ncbi:MAG: GvpL/GvpF family gas vesicle protein [Pseudomonadota bacterium]
MSTAVNLSVNEGAKPERLLAVMRYPDAERSIAKARQAAPDLRLRSIGALGLIVSCSESPKARRQRLRRLVIERQALEELLLHGPVLPARFAGRAALPSSLIALAADHQDVFEAKLAEHEGLAEYQILVSWRPDEVLRSLLVLPPQNATVDEKREKSANAAAAAEIQRTKLRDMIYAELGGDAHDAIERPVMQIHDIAAAAILMPRPDAEDPRGGQSERDGSSFAVMGNVALDRLLTKIDDLWSGMLTVRCIGPLPPISFATIALDATDKHDTLAARRQLGVAATDSKAIRDARKRTLKAAIRENAPGDVIDALRAAADHLLRRGARPHVDTEEQLSLRFERADATEHSSLARHGEVRTGRGASIVGAR